MRDGPTSQSDATGVASAPHPANHSIVTGAPSNRDTGSEMIDPYVVVLEDDLELRSLVTRGLREEGFDVTTAGSAAEMFDIVPGRRPDALVVDIGLPDADGRDVVQALRAQGEMAPVIFLTARDALPDRLSGFAAGGDDYLTKPFAFAELVARLHALMKRTGSDLAALVGNLRLDPATPAASCGGGNADLTPTEFRILARLAARPGDAVRRRQLVEAGWAHGAIVHDNTLDVYIARLRRKLSPLPGAPQIATVHGVGYSLR
jgi:two-component system OmpR family response regulator